MANRKRAVFVAVRRLRFGILARNVAGEYTDETAERELDRLAAFAELSGLEEEAEEIRADLKAYNADRGEAPWAERLAY